MSLEGLNIALIIGEIILEGIYGVEISELNDNNRNEIMEQRYMDLEGFGINGGEE